MSLDIRISPISNIACAIFVLTDPELMQIDCDSRAITEFKQ